MEAPHAAQGVREPRPRIARVSAARPVRQREVVPDERLAPRPLVLERAEPHRERVRTQEAVDAVRLGRPSVRLEKQAHVRRHPEALRRAVARSQPRRRASLTLTLTLSPSLSLARRGVRVVQGNRPVLRLEPRLDEQSGGERHARARSAAAAAAR